MSSLVSGGALETSHFETNLCDALRFTSESYPDKGMLFYDSQRKASFLSYKRMLEDALCLLRSLREDQGLERGHYAILQIQEQPKLLTTFWACLLGGIIPLIVSIPTVYDCAKNSVAMKLYHAWDLLKRPKILCTTTNLKWLVEVFGAGLVIDVTECPQKYGDHQAGLAEISGKDVAFLQLSSGSTGRSKCIQESHEAVIAHVAASSTFNGYSSQDVCVNWLPFDHIVPILTVHLRDVVLGCNEVHCETAVVMSDPLFWLVLLERHKSTWTWAPNFAFLMVADSLSRDLAFKADLTRVKRFMNAGEQVTYRAMTEFVAKTQAFGVTFEKIQPAFGMAEVCTCCTYNNVHEKEPFRVSIEQNGRVIVNGDGPLSFVSLGPPTPTTEIRIVDSNNDVLEELCVGRFQIRSPSVTLGYLFNDAANEESFVGHGWFNTGDLGFVYKKELYLTGREKESIIIRGANMFCYDIEETVCQKVQGLNVGLVAAVGVFEEQTQTEGIAVAFARITGKSSPFLRREIAHVVREAFNISPSVVAEIPLDEFPRTTSGKIQRAQIRQCLEKREWWKHWYEIVTEEIVVDPVAQSKYCFFEKSKVFVDVEEQKRVFGTVDSSALFYCFQGQNIEDLKRDIFVLSKTSRHMWVICCEELTTDPMIREGLLAFCRAKSDKLKFGCSNLSAQIPKLLDCILSAKNEETELYLSANGKLSSKRIDFCALPIGISPCSFDGVIVTGASGALGSSLIPWLCESAKKVIVITRKDFDQKIPNLYVIKSTLKELKGLNDALEQLANVVEGWTLLHFAGLFCADKTEDMEETWHSIFDGKVDHLDALVRTIKRKSALSRIVGISSTSTLLSFPVHSFYAAANGCLDGFVQRMRTEEGICATSLTLGMMETSPASSGFWRSVGVTKSQTIALDRLPMIMEQILRKDEANAIACAYTFEDLPLTFTRNSLFAKIFQRQHTFNRKQQVGKSTADIVRSVASKVLQIPVNSFTDDAEFGILGLDSVSSISFWGGLVKEFPDISIPVTVVYEYRSIVELVSFLERQMRDDSPNSSTYPSVRADDAIQELSDLKATGQNPLTPYEWVIKSNNVKFALVPWDAKVFGFPVYAMEAEDVEQESFAEDIGNIIEEWKREHEKVFAVVRFDAPNLKRAHAFAQFGFYHAECAVTAVLNMREDRSFREHFPGFVLKRAQSEEQFAAARLIAEESYYGDRFHNDPFLDQKASNARYRNWVSNAVLAGEPILVMEDEERGDIVGFVQLRLRSENTVEISLIAVSPKQVGGGLGMVFLEMVLALLKRKGVQVVQSKISTSNLSSLNSHISCGFTVKSPEVVLHYCYDKSKSN